MPYNWKHWAYLYTDKKPIGRERKFHLVGERLVDPEYQSKTLRSCYYAKDQLKINKLQEEFLTDRLGRKIFHGIDRIIILTANQQPLLIWKPLYNKGKGVVLQCMNPGFTEYRCIKKAIDCLVITDQVMSNEAREQEQYELVAINRNKTGYAIKGG